jgi:predicted metal-dependent enzyme (double-stranded beta helix superfamily)
MRTSPLSQPAAAVPPDIAAVLMAVPPHPAMAAAARAVTPARLVATAQRLVAEAEHWRHRVGFAPEDRTAVRIERTDEYEAWALGWLPGQDTGTHDHIGSNAALCVVEGHLRLRSTAETGPTRTHALAPGTVRVIGSTDAHRLWNAAAEPAVSIHVYAPTRSMRPR